MVTTVGIIEGSVVARLGIEAVLTADPRLSVLASCASVAEFDRAAMRPDVIVVDLDTCADPEGGRGAAEGGRGAAEGGRGAAEGGRGAADASRTVARLAGICPVLVYVAGGRAEDLMTALWAGARGLVSDTAGVDELLAAVSAAARGGLYLSADVAARVGTGLWQHAAHDPRGLARREIDTLRLIAHGYTHHQIARRLGLTEATVNTYVKRIRTKLGAGNKAELTRMAIDLGYVVAAPVGHVIASAG